MAMPEDADRIESLYLRALSRKPTADEIQSWTDFVNSKREVAITAPPPPQQSPTRPGPNNKQPGQPQTGRPQGQAGSAPGVGARMAARAGLAPQNPKLQAYEDMFWALLNSSEFSFNH
jgi:hypothetical protein